MFSEGNADKSSVSGTEKRGCEMIPVLGRTDEVVEIAPISQGNDERDV